jgi:hypothetical protein
MPIGRHPWGCDTSLFQEHLLKKLDGQRELVPLDEIPQRSGRTLRAPSLLPGFVDIRKQSFGINAQECYGAFFEPGSHTFGIGVCPDSFFFLGFLLLHTRLLLSHLAHKHPSISYRDRLSGS